MIVELRKSDEASGEVRRIDRIPFSVGSQDADWMPGGYGVWAKHLIIDQDSDRRFILVPQPPASVMLEGKPVEEPTRLRNGDWMELGSLRLQFRLTATRQKSLRSLELMTWAGLITLAGVQLWLAARW